MSAGCRQGESSPEQFSARVKGVLEQQHWASEEKSQANSPATSAGKSVTGANGVIKQIQLGII